MGDRRGYIIEILLPLSFNDGAAIPDEILGAIRDGLVERFGGLTAFTRSPAEGVWVSEDRAHRDDVVVLEIMTDALDRDWWREWRRRAGRDLRQDEIVVRATAIDRL